MVTFFNYLMLFSNINDDLGVAVGKCSTETQERAGSVPVARQMFA